MEMNVSCRLPTPTLLSRALVSTYFDLLSVPHCLSFVSSVFGSLLLLLCPFLVPSVSFVVAAALQSQDALETFRPDGRQLFVHIEAKLRVLLWQTEE